MIRTPLATSLPSSGSRRALLRGLLLGALLPSGAWAQPPPAPFVPPKPAAARTENAAIPAAIPLPLSYDLQLTDAPATGRIILAGGCYWGMQAVFQHVKGVSNVIAGYTGGLKSTANYAKVTGDPSTGHAEAVLIEYDTSKLTLGTLLQIYFFVAHDPTQLNRQGPDVGPQYRSSIFTDVTEEKRVAVTYMNDIDAAKLLPHPIATKLRDTFPFYKAEGYHQNYVQNHPTQRYVLYNDQPKIARLKSLFPQLYRDTPLRYVPDDRRTPKLPPKPGSGSEAGTGSASAAS